MDLVPEAIASVRALLQLLTEKNLIAESGSVPSPSPSPRVQEEKVEEVKEEARVLQRGHEEKKRITLRKGSEGDEVREMQVTIILIDTSNIHCLLLIGAL